MPRRRSRPSRVRHRPPMPRLRSGRPRRPGPRTGRWRGWRTRSRWFRRPASRRAAPRRQPGSSRPRSMPRAPRPQAREIAGRITQSVGMVDPKPIDQPALDPVQDQAVHVVEDRRILDPQPDQVVDVEEAPIAEVAESGTPRRQPVVLFGQQRSSRSASALIAVISASGSDDARIGAAVRGSSGNRRSPCSTSSLPPSRARRIPPASRTRR